MQTSSARACTWDTIRHCHGNDVRQTGSQVVVMVLAEFGYF